jgi:hypothetical protein
MPLGRRSREAPPPTVHNTVASFGSGQLYTECHLRRRMAAGA